MSYHLVGPFSFCRHKTHCTGQNCRFPLRWQWVVLTFCLRSSALSTSFPFPANWMRHHQTKRTTCQFAVAFAAMIFKPCSMVRILVQVTSAEVVTLSTHHTAQAGEEAFGLVSQEVPRMPSRPSGAKPGIHSFPEPCGRLTNSRIDLVAARLRCRAGYRSRNQSRDTCVPSASTRSRRLERISDRAPRSLVFQR